MKMDIPMLIKKNRASFFAGTIFLIIAAIIFFFPSKPKVSQPITLSDYSSISTICKLATLKSFYHNVAVYEETPDGGNKFVNNILFWPFGNYTKVGYKQFWLEYTGIVETGIDAGQIQITGPNTNGIVDVYIPNAEIIDVYADEKSITEPLSESGWFTSISSKEKMQAFATAQSSMRQEAENDQTLLKRAKENAKILLERYFINVGNEMGINLSVNWIDKP